MLRTLMDCFVLNHPTFHIYVGGSLRETEKINEYSNTLRKELGKLFNNMFGMGTFKVYDEWTNCGARVDLNFIEYAKSNQYVYADVLNSEIQSAVLQVNLDYLNSCQIFIGLGPFGKSTYCEIGYVCSNRDKKRSGEIKIIMIKQVDESLNQYDIMDKITDLVIYSDKAPYKQIDEVYHPVRYFLFHAYPWNKLLLTTHQPIVLPLEFIEQLYLTAVCKLKNVYGLKFRERNFEWSRVRPLTFIKTLRFFSGFWGEGKTTTLNNHEYWKTVETEQHFRKPLYMQDVNGCLLEIPTVLEIWKYYGRLPVENDTDFHWYYYLWSIMNVVINLVMVKQYTTNIVFDRFVVDHMAFAMKYHNQSSNECYERMILFLSILKTFFPNARIENVLLRKFDVAPFNTVERKHEYEAYGSKSMEELNIERNDFYLLLRYLSLDIKNYIDFGVVNIDDDGIEIEDDDHFKKLHNFSKNDLFKYVEI